MISCELEGLGTEAALSVALEAWVGVVLGGVRQARRRRGEWRNLSREQHGEHSVGAARTAPDKRRRWPPAALSCTCTSPWSRPRANSASGTRTAIAEAVERPLVRWLTARALLALPPDGSRRAKPPCCCHGDCPTCRLCGGCVRDESAVALSCPCYVPADECVVWNLFAFWNCTCGSELAECRVHRHAAWAPLADAAEDAAVVAAEPAAELPRREPA